MQAFFKFFATFQLNIRFFNKKSGGKDNVKKIISNTNIHNIFIKFFKGTIYS